MQFWNEGFHPETRRHKGRLSGLILMESNRITITDGGVNPQTTWCLNSLSPRERGGVREKQYEAKQHNRITDYNGVNPQTTW